MEIKTKKK